MLDRTGLSPSAAGYVGIRVLFDGDKRPVDSVPKAELAQLLEAEWEAGTTPQTRGMGQMLHFITHPAD
jgi:hypothetical protein